MLYAAHDNANVTLLKALDRFCLPPAAACQRHHRSHVSHDRADATVSRLRAPCTAGSAMDAASGCLAAGGDPSLNAMLRDTVSLTVLRAGYKVNVIPEHAEPR